MNQNDVKQTVNTTQNSVDDEIDLFELWEGLLQEKLTILISFFVVVILAAVYAFSVTPVYKASSYLLPPANEKISSMNDLAKVLAEGGTRTREGSMNRANAANESDITYSVESVFKQFRVNLGSRRLLKSIFDQYGLVEFYSDDIKVLTGVEKLKEEKKAFDKFVKDFSIDLVDKKEILAGMTIHLSLALKPGQVAEILNQLVARAEKNTINQITQQIVSEQQTRKTLIQHKIAGARKIESDRRLDKLALLNEAIVITKKLGIKKPVSAGPTLNINNVNTTSGQSISLYLLGSELLIAEKEVLEARTSNDAFIENLRGWEGDLRQLGALKIEPNKFGVVEIDQLAIFADKVKPRKGLILAVAGVLGLMLGIFIALTRRAVKNRKVKTAEVA